MPLALLLGALVGISLGLLGGGGSILAIPLLAYGLGLGAKEAIQSSLGVVGLAALGGAGSHARARSLDLRAGLLFGASGAGASFGGAQLARFLTGPQQLVLFAVLGLVAAFFMLRGRRGDDADEAPRERGPLATTLLAGAGAGLVTGVAGVGGGFVIVPSLTLVAGLPMRKAVGTSLLVIAVNSLGGFAGYITYVKGADPVVWAFAAAAVASSVAAGQVAHRIPQRRLRQAFGVLLGLVALGTLARETLWPRPDAAAVAAARQRADRAADGLVSRLMGELSAAIEKGGPASAVSVCNAHAPEITLAAQAAGVVVRRTSLRTRNPANAPDPWERAWLEAAERDLAAGKRPAPAQEVVGGELRVIRPIVFPGGVCARCHGAPGEIAEDVAKVLRERYPDDRATGFRAGDLRGAVSVRVALSN